jgi:hypothetical protein
MTRRAIVVSVLFHLALIAVLLFWYVPLPTGSQSADVPPRADGQRLETPPPRPATAPTLAENPEVPKEQIEASIEAQIEAAESLSDERKLTELEKNLGRLESIASEDSVREVTATIAGSLGLEPGPRPAEQPPAGAFDPDTAQILEVNRAQGPGGRWQYTSLLVDAEGRTQQVPLTESEGESAYKTMQTLKRYPIADGIYRQLVMPMIQSMIEASEKTQQAARQGEATQSQAADALPIVPSAR